MARSNSNNNPLKKYRGRGVYLTTRDLRLNSRRAIKAAAAKTMEVMGYNVVSLDGWIVRKYPDGSVERISKIATTNQPLKLD